MAEVKEKDKKQEWRRALRIDWLIDVLEGSKNVMVSEKDTSKFSLISQAYFNNALVLFGEPNPQVDIYFTDATVDLLPPTFDITYCFIGSEGDFLITFHRLRRCSLKELRGVKVFSGIVLEKSFGGIAKGEFYGAKALYGQTLNKKSWVKIDRSQQLGNVMNAQGGMAEIARGFLPDSEVAGERESMQIQFGVSIAFSQQYQWCVRFKNGKQRSVRIACHPLEISALFKLREKYAETDRRKALKHWVTTHWRTIKKTDEFNVQTFVRDYLRGQREFQWFGLDCKIIIPPKELQFIESLKKNREAMKEPPRTDRREIAL